MVIAVRVDHHWPAFVEKHVWVDGVFQSVLLAMTVTFAEEGRGFGKTVEIGVLALIVRLVHGRVHQVFLPLRLEDLVDTFHKLWVRLGEINLYSLYTS